jgi:hypothetical protein
MLSSKQTLLHQFQAPWQDAYDRPWQSSATPVTGKKTVTQEPSQHFSQDGYGW